MQKPAEMCSLTDVCGFPQEYYLVIIRIVIMIIVIVITIVIMGFRVYSLRV